MILYHRYKNNLLEYIIEYIRVVYTSDFRKIYEVYASYYILSYENILKIFFIKNYEYAYKNARMMYTVHIYIKIYFHFFL